jgi:hypothetical protein
VITSPDSRAIAALTKDAVVLWDRATGRERRLPFNPAHNPNERGFGFAFSLDGARVAALVARALRVWDVASGTEVAAIDVGAPSGAAAFLPRGDLVAVHGEDGIVRVVSTSRRAVRFTLRALAHRDAAIVMADTGHFETFGATRGTIVCRAGRFYYPIELCEERFATRGLLPKLAAGDDSYAEP